MKLNNSKEEPLTPICTTENIPLFVMYIKSELSNDHKDRLDKHLQNCIDCKMNLAYVKEILQFKHPISIDEKTLLLKCLTDPLFYYFINNVKKEVFNDVKNLIQEKQIDDSKIKNINKTSTNNIKQPNKPNEYNKKTIYPKSTYSYLMLATSMAVFLMLGSFILLGLGIKYPALQAYLPFSKQVGAKNSTDLTSNLIVNAKENNLYQQLDSAIDEYLKANNKESSEKAEIIAKDIKLRYEDNYGIDLVKYYKSVPDSAIKILAENRKKLSSLTEQPINDNYDKNLVELEKIAQSFTSYGDLIDAHKAKILIARMKVKTFKYDEAETTINEGLSFAQKNNYLMLESYFTLWQAKRLVEIPDFSLAQDLFNKTIELGKKLEITELFVSSSMTLAGIYLKNDDNEQALKVAQDVLANAKSYNVDYTVSLLQMAGVAAFNNKFDELSKTYLNQAITLSEEHKKPHLLVMSYTFMGLTLSESNQFSQAEDFYLKAKLAANNIEQTDTRLAILSITLGYEAKTKLNQGDLQTATKLYQETLTIIKDLKINNDLEISQLERGLAIALEKSGKEAQAQEHFAIAKTHQSMAESKKENANFLLSFLPSKYNPNNQ